MPTLFVTAPPEDAASIAERLVEERRAACVNRFPCRSTYRWDGEVHDEDEEILLVKTTESGYEDAKERIAELHPYDLPAIERFDDSGVSAEFADWLDDCVAPTE
ncbi:divalent cation tolerance protein [Halorientalis persicus]|jgi:periplasmic divalent cation tolerance protein|uniref:Divalent cation tolerance protein n=1 Tax=Halorientalis persicus TaxID=1367881 RepID=A0A1H8R0I3_9EURY|nr:divalent-cation tolerance protein CutA [Halorientalis persicus]SEO59965.1 divalent cation tolerance protein [Halorientalis persicus]